MRTGGRVAEGGGVLSRWALRRLLGSNPSPSVAGLSLRIRAGVAPGRASLLRWPSSHEAAGESRRFGVRLSRASTPSLVVAGGPGHSWYDTVGCENGGSWLDSPGFYRCGLQFDPMWERVYGRLCP